MADSLDTNPIDDPVETTETAGAGETTATDEITSATETIPVDEAGEAYTEGGDDQESRTTEEAPPEFSPELLDRAGELGYPAEEAQSVFKTPEALETALTALDREIVRVGMGRIETARTQQAMPDNGSARGVAGPVAAEASAQAAGAAPPELHDLKPLAGEDYDNALVEFSQQAATQINAMRQAVAGMGTFLESRERQRQIADHQTRIGRFDDALGQLGEEWGSIIGKGRQAELTADSPSMRNRAKLFDAVESIEGVYLQRGQTPPPLGTMLQRAASVVFPDKTQQMARNRVHEQLRAKQKGLSQAPTSRRTRSTLSGDEAAAAAIEEKLKEFGVSEY